MTTEVKFLPHIDPKGSRRLTNEQWLGLIEIVDSRVGWSWAMPEKKGDPVRVLPPNGDECFRVDADGTRWREPFHQTSFKPSKENES